MNKYAILVFDYIDLVLVRYIQKLEQHLFGIDILSDKPEWMIVNGDKYADSRDYNEYYYGYSNFEVHADVGDVLFEAPDDSAAKLIFEAEKNE